jgi:hypothetical protein
MPPPSFTNGNLIAETRSSLQQGGKSRSISHFRKNLKLNPMISQAFIGLIVTTGLIVYLIDEGGRTADEGSREASRI